MTGNPIRWAELTSRTKLPSGFLRRAISILGGDPGSFTMSSTIKAALFGSIRCANVVRNGNFLHLLFVESSSSHRYFANLTRYRCQQDMISSDDAVIPRCRFT